MEGLVIVIGVGAVLALVAALHRRRQRPGAQGPVPGGADSGVAWAGGGGDAGGASSASGAAGAGGDGGSCGGGGGGGGDGGGAC